MEFGVFLTASIPKPWAAGEESRVLLAEQEFAIRAEEAGFGYCWTSEHHFMEEYCHSAAPELRLAAIASRTSRIRLGHGIVDMQPAINHPIRVAERIATLDILSGGRVEFGSGRGSGRWEWDGFNVPEAETKAVWEEAVQCVLAMWQTDRFTWDGTHIKVPGPRNVVPKPVQQPHPPLWMGATNPATAREAGQRGVGALLFAYTGIKDIAERVRLYHDGAAHPAGRFSDRLNLKTCWAIGGICEPDDKKAITDYFELYLARYAPFFARYWPQAVGGTLQTAQQFTQASRRGPVDVEQLIADGSVFSGDVHRVTEAVHRAQETGVTQLILGLPTGYLPKERLLRTLDAWGEHIIPRFSR